MSLIIAVYVPTGIALSGDSRTTGTLTQPPAPATNPPASSPNTVVTNVVISDAAEKIFLIHGRFGVGTFGDAVVNNMPIAHYVQEFSAAHPSALSHTPRSVAADILAYFRALAPTPNSGFVVAGYDASVPFVLHVDVQNNAVNHVNVVSGTTQLQYGIVRGGDTAVVDRLLSQQQFNPLFNVMNIQDAVDFSRHLIRSTIDQLRFEPRFATVGGPIDTLIVSPTGARFLSQKTLACT